MRSCHSEQPRPGESTLCYVRTRGDKHSEPHGAADGRGVEACSDGILATMRGRGVGVLAVVCLQGACLADGSSETGEAWVGIATSSSSTSTEASDSSSTSSPSMTESSSGTDAGSSEGSSSGSTTESPGDADGGGGGGGPPPLGPACSVQEVTRGDEYNPLTRGEAGQFPVEVANALEDYCGCHTLANNRQNIEWEFLRPPGNTLFLAYDDLSRSYEGSTLGQAMAVAVAGGMPPGSCPHPEEPLALLAAWFQEGMPDAVEYEG